MRSGMMTRLSISAVSLLIAVTAHMPALADEDLQAELPTNRCQAVLLLGVVDGDTVHGYIDTSDPSVAVRVKIRLEGIDTPEAGGRARCPEERERAGAAKAFLQEVLAPGLERPTRSFARACAIRDDKYASRRLSRLEIAGKQKSWQDVGDMLIARGLAFPYKGGRRGDTWCTCLRRGQCPAGYLGGS